MTPPRKVKKWWVVGQPGCGLLPALLVMRSDVAEVALVPLL